MAVKVILDANFLFIPSQFKIDIFEQLADLLNQRFELILLSTTLQELQTIAKEGPPTARKQASLALSLAEKCQQISVEKKPRETNDDVILRIAAEWNSPVATNDRELREKLRAMNIPVVFLRAKRRLELDGTT